MTPSGQVAAERVEANMGVERKVTDDETQSGGSENVKQAVSGAGAFPQTEPESCAPAETGDDLETHADVKGKHGTAICVATIKQSLEADAKDDGATDHSAKEEAAKDDGAKDDGAKDDGAKDDGTEDSYRTACHELTPDDNPKADDDPKAEDLQTDKSTANHLTTDDISAVSLIASYLTPGTRTLNRPANDYKAVANAFNVTAKGFKASADAFIDKANGFNTSAKDFYLSASARKYNASDNTLNGNDLDASGFRESAEAFNVSAQAFNVNTTVFNAKVNIFDASAKAFYVNSNIFNANDLSIATDLKLQADDLMLLGNDIVRQANAIIKESETVSQFETDICHSNSRDVFARHGHHLTVQTRPWSLSQAFFLLTVTAICVTGWMLDRSDYAMLAAGLMGLVWELSSVWFGA